MNLKETFNKELLPQLQEKLGIDNVMAVPKLTKVVINMGVGEALTDKKHLESAVNDLESIAGQKAVITKAKKSVASFKLREGWPVGCKVTLRGDRMYDFIERLVNVAIPRERDFRGLNPKSFDGQGNYSMGIKEQIIFPKIPKSNRMTSEYPAMNIKSIIKKEDASGRSRRSSNNTS